MKRIRWKSGAGEFLGFSIVAPILTFILLYVITIFQVASCEQRLIYSSYMAGRKAVVSFNKEEALEAMNDEISRIYGSEASSVTCSIGIDEASWIKGNVTLITVSQDLVPILPLGKGVHSRSIGMMIEHSQWIDESYHY